MNSISRSAHGVPNSGWPISKTDLATEYQRALELEGVAPCILRDGGVWDAAHIEAPPLGTGLESFFTRVVPSARLWKTLIDGPWRTDPRIAVYLHANFYRFNLSATGNAFVAAECPNRVRKKTFLYGA